MKVADLRQYLIHLADLLTPGSKDFKDLITLADGFAPFAEMTAKEFANHLATPKTPAAPKARTKATRVAPDVSGICAKIHHIYEHAGDGSVSSADIDDATAQLSQLTKNDLVAVAEKIEMAGMARKSKPQIVAAITARIRELRGTVQRAGLLDRPAESFGQTASP